VQSVLHMTESMLMFMLCAVTIDQLRERRRHIIGSIEKYVFDNFSLALLSSHHLT
jgi:hypothetical protein